MMPYIILGSDYNKINLNAGEIQITMAKKNNETDSLQRQVNYLEQAIAVEEQKEKELMAKIGLVKLNELKDFLFFFLFCCFFFSRAHSLASDDSKQEEYLKKLSDVIADIYKKIFNDSPVTNDPLKNLASVENRLEELFQEIDLLDKQNLEEKEKEKEKERRRQLREEKKSEEERATEEKKRKAALRAKEPPKKYVGRRIAERSKPPELKRADQDTINKTNEEEEELAYYFT